MSDEDEPAAMWPGSPYALVDTRLCPGCFHPLASTTCGTCGLVLADPRAMRLLELGQSMLGLETERQQLIDEIRRAHEPIPDRVPTPAHSPAWWEASAPAGTTATSPPEPAAVPTRMPTAAPGPVPDPDAAAVPSEPVQDSDSPAAADVPGADVPGADVPGADVPPMPPAPVAASVSAAPSRRRLTVPVLLLIVGVSLVGIAAIFFLVLAWNIADIRMRALIIGGVTLATMAVAWLLRRWLNATAEAIGALGVILLGLDAWAVRANDLFGAGGVDAVVYAGVAALGVGAVCRVWSVVSRLRGPDLAATLALPVGLGLLIAGLLPLETSGAITAGFLGTAVGGLAHALPAPWSAARSRPAAVPERAALAVIGVAALLGGAAMLVVGLESTVVQLVSAVAVVALGTAYAVLLRPRGDGEALPASRALGAAAAAIAAATAASLGWQLAAHSDLPVYAELVAPVIAVGVAVALDRWQRVGTTHLAARIAAGLTGAVSVIALVVVCGGRAVQSIAGTWMLWHTPVAVAPPGADTAAAVLAASAAATIAVLLFFAPTVDLPAPRRVRPVAAAVLVIIGVAGTGIPIVIVGAAISVAAIAVVALARGGTREGWGAAAGLAALTAFLAGLAAPWLWAVGVLVAVVVPITVRVIARPTRIGAVVLALAPVAVLTAAAVIAPAAISAARDVGVDARAAFVLLQWVALGVLACAARLRLDAASRTGLAVASYGLVVISFLALLAEPAAPATVSATIGEPLLGILRTAALVVLLVVVALARTRIGAVPSLGAAALVAPAAASLAIAAFETAHVTDDGWAALTVTAAAVAVVWLGALIPAGAHGIAEGTLGVAPAHAALARRAADVGALAVVIATVAWGPVPAGFHWAMLLLIAAGFAGASVTRGWAGPTAGELDGVPETRAAGVPLARAPRRLLAWPAFAAATLALWSWLDGAHEIEAYVLAPAVGLVLFAALLSWLRRQVEATIAAAAGFALGLVVPAVAAVAAPFGIVGRAAEWDSTVRGTVVAIVAAALTAALAWTPIRRVRMPALAGAVVAVLAVAVIAVERAVTEPAGTGWLLLLVAIAYAAAFGFIRGSSPQSTLAGAPSAPAEVWFAVLVPPAALAVAVLATIPSRDEPLVVAVSLGLLGALHLMAAALARAPLSGATRWTAFAGAIVVATGAFQRGDVEAIELLSLPLAAVLAGGAALAMWRRERTGRPWPGGERIAWLAGLALAVVPSVAAAPNDPRAWLVVAGATLAAIGCAVAPIAGSAALKAPSALLLSAGALAMGLRSLLAPGVESGEIVAMVAGAGGLVVAAAMVWMDEPDAAPAAPTALGAAGAGLLVAAVGVQSEGELLQATLTAIVAATVGVGGAALLRWRRWAGLGAVLAVGGLVGALLAVGRRFAAIAALDDAGAEPDLWALLGLGIVAAIGVMALRSTVAAAVAIVVDATFSIALVLFAAAELVLLGGPGGDEVRTVLTMSALTATGVVGWLCRSRLGVVLAPTAAVLAVAFGIVALTLFAVRPVELVTVPPALGLLALGARALRRDAALRTWPALGPGLALLTVPSLLHDFGETTLWRAVALGVVAAGLVVAGAVWRLQAPLVLGSVVLLVHAIAQLWPWISIAYEAVPWWLWLGVGGALLIFLAARYERRMRAIRAAFTAVTSLR